MKRDILILSALCTCFCNLFLPKRSQSSISGMHGPYEIKGPFIVDSLDVNSKKFTDAELLKTAIPFNNVRKSNRTLDRRHYSRTKQKQLRQPRLLLSEQRPLYGRDSSDQRTRALRSIYRQRETDTRQRRAQAHTRTPPLRSRNQISYSPGRNEPHSESHLQDGQQSRCHGDNRSREALHFERCLRWHTHSFRQPLPQRQIPVDRLPDDLSRWRYRILPASDRPGHRAGFNGKLNNHHYSWMPRSNRLYYTRKGMQGKELVTIDPATQAEEVLAHNLPDGWFSFCPDRGFPAVQHHRGRTEEKGKTFRKSLCLTTASRDGVPVHSSISTTWQPECSNALPTGTLRLPSTIFPTTAAICSSLVANGS